MTGTSDQGFDPRIADWLEEDPDRAPDGTLEVVLAASRSIPQTHAWRVRWRFSPMIRMLLVGSAAVAAVLMIGVTFLPRSGPSGPGAAPTPSPSVSLPSTPGASGPAAPASTGPLTACGLLTGSEVSDALSTGGLGAAGFPTGASPKTSCTWTNGPGDVVLRMTLTSPGGAAAFATSRAVSGVQLVSGVGADAVFDPATGTLTLLKGDSSVTIEAGSLTDLTARRLELGTRIGKQIVGRI